MTRIDMADAGYALRIMQVGGFLVPAVNGRFGVAGCRSHIRHPGEGRDLAGAFLR